MIRIEGRAENKCEFTRRSSTGRSCRRNTLTARPTIALDQRRHIIVFASRSTEPLVESSQAVSGAYHSERMVSEPERFRQGSFSSRRDALATWRWQRDDTEHGIDALQS